MTLEEFEKELASKKALEKSTNREKDHHKHRQRHRSSRHERHGRERRNHHKDRENEDHLDEKSYRRQKRPRISEHTHDSDRKYSDRETHLSYTTTTDVDSHTESLKRDAWMEAPSAFDIEYSRRGEKSQAMAWSQGYLQQSATELHAQSAEDSDHSLPSKEIQGNSEVDYIFGDEGSKWRMTKLRAVYSQAEEMGNSVDDIALERYGSLQAFDAAREEQIELDRRATYGKGYVGKDRPSGELFHDRKLPIDNASNVKARAHQELPKIPQERVVPNQEPVAKTVHLNQTALNRLKAQIIKAKLNGAPELAELEAEYATGMATLANWKEPDVVVLGAMDNRMLASRPRQPVQSGRRSARDKGAGDDGEMTIEDMMREERRTKGQAGGEGRRFAERIAKDAKFDDNLDYLDENASKLAKRVERSEINLRNTAISEFQKINRILDKCPLCHHEDTNKPPLAPLVSLATRVFLTLPTMPEIGKDGACIVPIQHRVNLLECDDDEWEEIRNFMKCLKRMYHEQGRGVIFYENAAVPERRRHAAMEVVPLPLELVDTVPAFFKEAILSSDEEWTQHKKLIDTLSRARNQGLGRLAFRRSIAKEMPYFHVWFELDGGLGHIVEDSNRWPKGDLFAREVLGGILGSDAQVIRRQGRWSPASDSRLETFKMNWTKYDWTEVLTNS